MIGVTVASQSNSLGRRGLAARKDGGNAATRACKIESCHFDEDASAGTYFFFFFFAFRGILGLFGRVSNGRAVQ